MSLINDPANTFSDYPRHLDTLPLYSNGVGAASVINADTWNTLESALYRVQTHTQSCILFLDSADRKRVAVSGVVTLSAGVGPQLVVMDNLTAGQLAFLNGNLQTTFSMFFADITHLTGTDDCTANILIGLSTVNVYINRTDPTQSLSGGHYLVNLTILGS